MIEAQKFSYLVPIIFVATGFFIGVIFERIVLVKLKKLSSKTRWKGDELVITSLRGMMILWFGLAGIYSAILNLPISPALHLIFEKILLIIIILSMTIVVSRIAVGMVKIYSQRKEGNFPATSIFTNFTRFIIFVLGILIILNSLNISITPMLTALGVGGLAVALALQDTLSNFFAGVQILASRQIKPNDYVKLDTGEEGYISDISWRNTTIKTLPNNMVIVPNSKLASAIVTNYNLPEQIIKVYIPVGVSYESDLEKVETVTTEVAKQVMREIPGGVPELEPVVRYNAFADFSINFNVVLYAREFTNQYALRHAFIKRLHERYNQEGIEIPFPIRTIYNKSIESNSEN